MKKIIFTMTLAVTAMNINAQLLVDSLGRVGIGTETPSYALSVNAREEDDCAMSCKATENFIGISVSNLTNEEYCSIYGGQLHAKNTMTMGSSYGAIGTGVGGNIGYLFRSSSIISSPACS